jgi:1-deoxy-D-xylulose-5-phosphate reductoisomerase
MAKECLNAGGAACCMLNAANEEAVAALLRDETMTLGTLYDVVEDTLQKAGSLPADTLEDILHADALAREIARERLFRR